ncbi:GNAT family N-acetyltransferase [Chitinophagaceae bacterium LWZ2-11]
MITIRPIQLNDNATIATIIRASLTEFGANKPGTVYYDDTTDHLFELFRDAPGSVYFIALNDDVIIGGAGIYPTQGLPQGTCEIVKIYLDKNARGTGLGKLLIEKCLTWAKENNYDQVYLETMPELKKAVTLYEKFGFEYLQAPLGNSGHTGCDIWMLRKL